MPDRAKHPVWYHLAEAYLRRLEGVIHATDHSIPNALPENIWKELGQLAELMGMSVKRTQKSTFGSRKTSIRQVSLGINSNTAQDPQQTRAR